MEFWMTHDGKYYEADTKIGVSDINVPRRPSESHVYHNGNWCTDEQNHEEYVHRVRLYPQQHFGRQYPQHGHQQVYAPYEPFYAHPEEVSQKQPVDDSKKKDSGVVLSESTKVMFGIRELAVIAAFVVTATISWQDTNTRIVKLEDSKHVEEINLKIKSIEVDLKALDKQSRSDNQKLEQTIRDLEQVVFMRNQKK